MARTPTQPQTAPLPETGDDEPLTSLEDHVIVVHAGGHELIETSALPTESTRVQEVIDTLPGDYPDTVAFDAAVHPEHSSVAEIDESFDSLDVKAELQQAWLNAGRLGVVVKDDVIKCVNPGFDGLTWYFAVEDGEDVHLDIHDEHVVHYHELNGFVPHTDISLAQARETIASEQVDAEVVAREELTTARKVA